jgi:hypothetical protein
VTREKCRHCNGTGFEPMLPTDAEIRAYMKATGWQEKPPGTSGAMWERGDRAIAVAHELMPGNLEYTSVIERLRAAENVSVAEIVDRIHSIAAATDG